MQYCSLQHQTLLSPPDTSTTGHCFHFGLASSFLLELFLHSSLIAYHQRTQPISHLFSASLILQCSHREAHIFTHLIVLTTSGFPLTTVPEGFHHVLHFNVLRSASGAHTWLKTVGF